MVKFGKRDFAKEVRYTYNSMKEAIEELAIIDKYMCSWARKHEENYYSFNIICKNNEVVLQLKIHEY